MNPLVSIVLPVYNGEKYLKESIESVLNQSYKSLELIIVNDCSTDSSETIIKEYLQKDNRIIYIKNQVNSKLPRSLNNGFAKAKGKYFTWTSDDNIFHNNAIENMVNYLEKNKDVQMVYCDYNIINEKGDFVETITVEEPERIIYKNIIGACFLYRGELARKIGGYALDRFLVEDYEYWLRINLNGNIGVLHKCLYDYRCHSSSLSETKKQEVQKELKRLRYFYLTEYERKKLPLNFIFKYFEYIIAYENSRANRIMLRCGFLLKHFTYLKYMLNERKYI